MIGPVMPFLAERIWRALVAEPVDGAPASVFLAAWPEAGEVDGSLLGDVAEARRVVGLGHQARSASG